LIILNLASLVEINQQFCLLMFFLNKNIIFLRYDQIDTVYGFTKDFVLTDDDLSNMYDGIGLRLPLSNSLVTYEDYKASKSFLKLHHRKGLDKEVNKALP
jgi:hypothetical protein